MKKLINYIPFIGLIASAIQNSDNILNLWYTLYQVITSVFILLYIIYLLIN
jgi:hypothetical protein